MVSVSSSTSTIWLTLTEAAAHTKYSKPTLRRAVRHGQLRVFKPTKDLRFRLEDLEAWMTRGNVTEVR